MPTLSYQDALSYSLKLLSGRQRANANLRSLLEKRGCTPSNTRKVLARLEQLNLLNDQTMAEQVTEDLMKRQPGGRRRLQHVLRKKHIPSNIACALVDKIDDEQESKRAIQVGKLYEQKWKTLPRDRRRKRIYDLLVRRGFDFELCREVIEQVK